MQFDADRIACAGLVQRADPDRFMAVMAAPVAARGPLFALYAFNVEVARAPWMTNEPEIAAMRLQWWRDALAEIAAGDQPRRHEVVTPLAEILNRDQTALLDELIVARHWEINKKPFESTADLHRYIDQTSGYLVQVCAQLLGPADNGVAQDYGFATGLANWFRAVPELRARGCAPLPDPSPDAIRALAQDGLHRLNQARARRGDISKPSSAAFLVGWQAQAVLQKVVRNPSRVNDGTLASSEITRRISLMKQVLTGRW